MAVQLATDDSGDIYFDANGDLALVEDGEEVAQHVKQRLDFFQGEWFLDESVGVPWYQEIFQPRRGSNRLSARAYTEAILKDTILETPGVTRLLSFDFTSDEINRVASFTFRVDTAWGDVGTDFFDVSLNQ